MSRTARRLGKDPEHRKKVSAGVLRAMQSDAYWDNYRAGLDVPKNRAETKLEEILNDCLPGEFVFNGDGSQGIRIGNFTPDFVHSGDKKKVVELFGRRWHPPSDVRKKKSVYAKYGYECLVVWDDQLRNKKKVINRVTAFSCNPGVKTVRVVSVKRERFSGDVYNMTVEGTNTYFARGILVHNCGEGGMIVTDNMDYAERARLLRNLAFTTPRFYHHDVGYNYRMTNMQGALALSQFSRIDSIITKKRKIAALYTKYLQSLIPTHVHLPLELPLYKNIYWMYALTVESTKHSRDALAAYLRKRGIETRTMFCPLNLQPALISQGLVDTAPCPVAEHAWRTGLYLPSSLSLTDDQIRFICSSVHDYFSGAKC